MNIRPKFSLQPQLLVAFFRIIKIEVAISAVMICAMGILAMMALSKFNTTLAEVTDSRISVIVYDMRDNIEQGLALGINLQALENVEETIGRAAKRDKKISAIYVISKQGKVLYRSPATAPEVSPEAFSNFDKSVLKKPVMSSRDGNIINTVSVLQNSFSQSVGLLVVKYDATTLQQRFGAFRTLFVQQAFLFLLVGVILTAFTTWLLLKRFEKTDEHLAGKLEDGDLADYSGTEHDAHHSDLALFKIKEREVMDALIEAENTLRAR